MISNSTMKRYIGVYLDITLLVALIKITEACNHLIITLIAYTKHNITLLYTQRPNTLAQQ